MPLEPKYLEQIKLELKIDVNNNENLGTALRRACAFQPKEFSWQAHMDLIYAIASELAQTKPEELTKLNKERKNALHYAIDRLVKIAKAEPSSKQTEDLSSQLQIIQIICSFCPSSSLAIDDYLSQYMSTEFKSDDDFYYYGLSGGFENVPVSDVMIRAAKFILYTMRTGMMILEQPIPIALPPIYPIVIASAHIDRGIQVFFDDYLSTLTERGYALVCPELPTQFTPEQYLAIDKEICTFKDLRINANLEQQLQIGISQSVIRAANTSQAQVVFIDCTPAASTQESMFIAYLQSKLGIIDLVDDMREQAMARQAILSSLEHNTNPIMLVGTYHCSAIKTGFEDLGINARCLLVTNGTPDVQDLYPKDIMKQVQVIDFSKQPRRSEILQALGVQQQGPKSTVS